MLKPIHVLNALFTQIIPKSGLGLLTWNLVRFALWSNWRLSQIPNNISRVRSVSGSHGLNNGESHYLVIFLFHCSQLSTITKTAISWFGKIVILSTFSCCLHWSSPSYQHLALMIYLQTQWDDGVWLCLIRPSQPNRLIIILLCPKFGGSPVNYLFYVHASSRIVLW